MSGGPAAFETTPLVDRNIHQYAAFAHMRQHGAGDEFGRGGAWHQHRANDEIGVKYCVLNRFRGGIRPATSLIGANSGNLPELSVTVS